MPIRQSSIYVSKFISTCRLEWSNFILLWGLLWVLLSIKWHLVLKNDVDCWQYAEGVCVTLKNLTNCEAIATLRTGVRDASLFKHAGTHAISTRTVKAVADDARQSSKKIESLEFECLFPIKRQLCLHVHISALAIRTGVSVGLGNPVRNVIGFFASMAGNDEWNAQDLFGAAARRSPYNFTIRIWGRPFVRVNKRVYYLW